MDRMLHGRMDRMAFVVATFARSNLTMTMLCTKERGLAAIFPAGCTAHRSELSTRINNFKAGLNAIVFACNVIDKTSLLTRAVP